MTRTQKLVVFPLLISFTLACGLISQPIKDVQDLAGTAEALATSMPIETLQALPSAMPSGMPNLEDFNYFDPQGTPVKEWNGIPVMAQATAGEEFNSATYSFKTEASVKEAQDFYSAEMIKLGWSSTFNLPGDENGAVLLFSKDGQFLTVTITSVDGSTVVVFALA